ncbi:hypothetical protein D3C72_1447180 [compost metagenome]
MPVLPARSGRFNAMALLAVPKRTTSLSMLFIMKALRSSMTRLASSPARSGLACDKTLPSLSVTLAIR